MKVKDALIRGLRQAVFSFAAALTIARPAADLVGVKSQAIAQATSFAGAAIFGVTSGILAFAVNFGEDNTPLQLPK